MDRNYEALREHVFGLQIVDTHEHMAGREENRDKNADVLSEYLSHYFSCDLVSAGLTQEQLAAARDARKPLAERWRLVQPFWEAARLTGYGRSLDLAARDLYGIPCIDGTSIGKLNEAFRAARDAGGHYERVFKQKSKIRVSLLDSDLNCDRRFFRSVLRLDEFVTVQSRGQVAELGKRTGVAIHTLDDLKAACEKWLDTSLARGAAALKTGLAYLRSLRYAKATASAAEKEFNRIFADTSSAGFVQTHDLQNYMMHHVLKLADARGLAFQFHTGLQEGNGNFIYHSDPSLLSELFMEYENVRFDIFHISYPYEHVLSALAKNFRNVFIDFAWAHIISPKAATDALVEFLDAVPANKISCFGGDYCFIDGVYGHQYLARENIARALAAKVQQGVCDADTAKHIAQMILHDNPIAIFRLNESELS